MKNMNIEKKDDGEVQVSGQETCSQLSPEVIPNDIEGCETSQPQVDNMSLDEDSLVMEVGEANNEQSQDKVGQEEPMQSSNEKSPISIKNEIQGETPMVLETEDKKESAMSLESDTQKETSINKRPEEVCMQESSTLETDSPNVTAVEQASVYHLKWFEWKGTQTPIITQNENGPCPLLAIANVLILARKIDLPPMQQIISGKQLIEYIGDCILSSAPEQDRDNEELILNYQQNMQDAIDIMHKLQTGIDVNVKFSGVCDFEFTRECIVFDLLKIALYHGWLVDPQDTPTLKAINNMSYNQVVEKLLTSKESSDDNVVSEGLAIEDFLGRTASQLTYHGLCELNDTVQEEELCVFFRNNHFSTLYKHKNELFLLVTDQGFLTEPAVIWETLVNIEGDGQFVNSDYRTVQLQSNAVPPSPHVSSTPACQPPLPPKNNLSQEDQDYLLALSLQQEHQDPASTHNSSNEGVSGSLQHDIDSDHVLAMQLQKDEERQAALLHQQQQQQQQQVPTPNVVESDGTSQSQQQQPSTSQASDNQRVVGRGQQQGDKPSSHDKGCCIS